MIHFESETAMAGLEERLIDLENCIRRFNKVDEIIFMLLTNNGHRMTTSDDLEKLRSVVHEVNDENLSSFYNRILKEVRMSSVFPTVRINDYFVFLQRLGTLLNELTVQANETDIALREIMGLPADTGIWGGKGWHPSGQL